MLDRQHSKTNYGSAAPEREVTCSTQRLQVTSSGSFHFVSTKICTSLPPCTTQLQAWTTSNVYGNASRQLLPHTDRLLTHYISVCQETPRPLPRGTHSLLFSG